jgi:hypothetical protein
VVIEWPRGQVGHFDTRRRDLLGTINIWKTQDCISVSDVRIMPNQRHAEWRIEPSQKESFRFRDTIAIGVAQQCDLIGAGHIGARPLLHELRDPTLDTAFLLCPTWTVRLGN